MKVGRILAVVLLIASATYLAALYLADPRCKADGNPFDCDDDVFNEMIHIVPSG